MTDRLRVREAFLRRDERLLGTVVDVEHPYRVQRRRFLNALHCEQRGRARNDGRIERVGARRIEQAALAPRHQQPIEPSYNGATLAKRPRGDGAALNCTSPAPVVPARPQSASIRERRLIVFDVVRRVDRYQCCAQMRIRGGRTHGDEDTTVR
jgi:hypothetical protein